MQVLGYTGTFIIMLEKFLKINGGEFMREIFPKLFVGSQKDYEESYFVPEQWGIVLAAKEPWHRQAIGYTGRACDKAHLEYLMARRVNKLILNLVDAPKAEFFDKRIIDAALEFIEEQLNTGKSVLICCNQGESRSPSICLLYLIKQGIIKGDTFSDCEAEFMQIYPEYNPGEGIRGFMKEHWEEYCK
jgi:hypothetical protein